MCKDLDKNPPVTHAIGVWTEKITDSIMYLILLYAYVCEKQKGERTYE